MKLLNEYSQLQDQLFDYFGFKQEWLHLPVIDVTGCYWDLGEDSIEGDCVVFIEEEEFSDFPKCHYKWPRLEHRFFKKWIYPGKDYTMLVVDTQTDGNRVLAIFDNSKRRRDINTSFKSRKPTLSLVS